MRNLTEKYKLIQQIEWIDDKEEDRDGAVTEAEVLPTKKEMKEVVKLNSEKYSEEISEYIKNLLDRFSDEIWSVLKNKEIVKQEIYNEIQKFKKEWEIKNKEKLKLLDEEHNNIIIGFDLPVLNNSQSVLESQVNTISTVKIQNTVKENVSKKEKTDELSKEREEKMKKWEEDLRTNVDKLEKRLNKEKWWFDTYNDIISAKLTDLKDDAPENLKKKLEVLSSKKLREFRNRISDVLTTNENDYLNGWIQWLYYNFSIYNKLDILYRSDILLVLSGKEKEEAEINKKMLINLLKGLWVVFLIWLGTTLWSAGIFQDIFTTDDPYNWLPKY